MRISDWSSDVCSSDLAGACDFGVFTCTSAGCTGPNGAVGATLLAPGAFDTIVAAMRSALPRLEASNVSIIYRPTDLGFVGMPTPPVAAVTVEIADMPFDFVGRSEEHTSELQTVIRLS